MAGRPTVYKPEMCDALEEIGALGATKVQMAAHLGVSKQTFYTWMNEHPEFLDAVNHAMTLSESKFSQTLQENMVTHGKDTKFNTGVAALIARNAYKWDASQNKQEIFINLGDYDEQIQNAKKLRQELLADPDIIDVEAESVEELGGEEGEDSVEAGGFTFPDGV